MFETGHSIKENVIFKSCRISILSTPMYRTYPRVDQIYLQMKKLIFLKIGSPRWGCAQGAVSSPGIVMLWPSMGGFLPSFFPT